MLRNVNNIKHPTSIEELPNDIHQKIEAKFAVNVKAFVKRCTKDQWDKVT
jgi:hypothetical protein